MDTSLSCLRATQNNKPMAFKFMRHFLPYPCEFSKVFTGESYAFPGSYCLVRDAHQC